MVLKIVERRIVLEKDKTAGEIRKDEYFDDFDNLTIELVDMKKECENIPNSTYQFVTGLEVGCPIVKKEIIAKKIKLIGRNLRLIYVDDTYEVYLMSNEGKTIEKIN